MGRVLFGLALSILSAWMVLAPTPDLKHFLTWLPFLAPVLAMLVLRGVRLLSAAILFALLLLLLADTLASRWHGHTGEAKLLCYVLHVWFAGACMLAVLLSGIWRFALRPK